MAQEATTIARPYAEAVYKLATEQSTLDAWSELLAFYAAVMRDPAMTGISMNPQLSRQRLIGLLSRFTSSCACTRGFVAPRVGRHAPFAADRRAERGAESS